MIAVYGLLFLCTALSYGLAHYLFTFHQDGILSNKVYGKGSLLQFLLIGLLIWFAGLRTVMNDTGLYIISFRYRIPGTLSGLAQIDWNIGANPLFHIYQILIKSLISPNPQVFIFLTACIVETSMIKFLIEYSEDIVFSVYLFLAFTVFAFTMAAIKQTLATAIAIWAMPEIVRGNHIKAVFILAAAILFHPYVVVLAVAWLFVNKGVWNKNVILGIIATVITGIFFHVFIERAVEIAGSIGDNFNTDMFAPGTGVGIMRILAYMIVPILSLTNRDKLRTSSDSMQDLCVNLSIAAACLSFLSGFGGSVLFGRLPNYFDIFIILSIPHIIKNGKSEDIREQRILIFVLMAVFLFFYMTYYEKYFSHLDHPLTADIYKHTGIFSLFKQ